MALGDGSFRSRAASLLRAPTPLASHPPSSDTINEKGSKTSIQPSRIERGAQDPGHTGLEKNQPTSLAGKLHESFGEDAVAHDREAQRLVRTIPGQSFSVACIASIEVSKTKVRVC